MAMWMIIEAIKDPALLQAIREEVATAYLTDPETGSRTISVEKVVTLPLLQSVFTETLRLRVNFNLMRNVNEPITLDGFTLRKGSLLQAPSVIAHYDEATWASTGHPATEFCAERHVKYQDERDEAGKLCPGAPFFGFSGALPAILGIAPPPRRRFSVPICPSDLPRSGSIFSL